MVSTVVNISPSRSKPDRGIVTVQRDPDPERRRSTSVARRDDCPKAYLALRDALVRFGDLVLGGGPADAENVVQVLGHGGVVVAGAVVNPLVAIIHGPRFRCAKRPGR